MSTSSTRTLAPYAAHDDATQGRRHAEERSSTRSEFQRDRDRIIHSSAFRRLEYKTQVFVNHEGDLFRTRLTHSLEVAQIARSIARNLGLNEDLTEAISLAHDLGHTPFGHAGQDALNDCMTAHGGFEHNLQSLRVVDVLEERYGAFDGLNLCFETREGVLKHCSLENARTLGDVGLRFIERRQPSLEAQLANLADEIAYNNHDIDDGLRSGLLTIDQMMTIDLFARHARVVAQIYPGLAPRRLILETVRRMINELIVDVTRTTQENIAREASPKSVDDVRQRTATDRVQPVDPRRGDPAQAFSAQGAVLPLPRTADGEQGEADRCGIVRCILQQSQFAARRALGSVAGHRRSGHRRLCGRDDRSLCDL